MSSSLVDKNEFGLPTQHPADPPLYYIQNLGYCGNCMLWWCVDGKGYTCDLNRAWRVTKEKADQICLSRPHEDIPHPVEKINRMAQLHVNIETLLEYERKIAG